MKGYEGLKGFATFRNYSFPLANFLRYEKVFILFITLHRIGLSGVHEGFSPCVMSSK